LGGKQGLTDLESGGNRFLFWRPLPRKQQQPVALTHLDEEKKKKRKVSSVFFVLFGSTSGFGTFSDSDCKTNNNNNTPLGDGKPREEGRG
jgi:hypothetical protein